MLSSSVFRVCRSMKTLEYDFRMVYTAYLGGNFRWSLRRRLKKLIFCGSSSLIGFTFAIISLHWMSHSRSCGSNLDEYRMSRSPRTFLYRFQVQHWSMRQKPILTCEYYPNSLVTNSLVALSCVIRPRRRGFGMLFHL